MSDVHLQPASTLLPFQGILVRVTATISLVEPVVHAHGAAHQHLLVRDIRVLEVEGASPAEIDEFAFVAIHYGDREGLRTPIPDLLATESIELQGQYIPKNQAYPSSGNPGYAVIHFTHHPVGFVVYHGVRYQ